MQICRLKSLKIRQNERLTMLFSNCRHTKVKCVTEVFYLLNCYFIGPILHVSLEVIIFVFIWSKLKYYSTCSQWYP